MTSTFNFEIDTPSGPSSFEIDGGSSILFVGANGCGKTRLAVSIEDKLQMKAHRISAHRALTLNPSVAKISEEEALNGLRTGHARRTSTIQHRLGNRWGARSSVHLLNDYDRLIQSLFAEQSNTALETHNRVRDGYRGDVEPTKFEKLKAIWERLIAHRELFITGDNITVNVVGEATSYSAEELSDGERAIFYLIGQTLCAESDSVLIFDEPELHIHRSIMSSLWDELEAIRPDCAFVFISHDLEFVSSRVGQKYIIREYNPTGTWVIEEVPETGFCEEITTQILGSRRPILFVEGSASSLDHAIYRNCYSGWTIIPRGACEDVIHSVVTMRNNDTLTRVTCSGIVDADDYSPEEIAYLDTLGVKVLPVSEIENMFLLPNIATAIFKQEGYEDAELEVRLEAMYDDVIEMINHGDNIEGAITRYCRRRIDRLLKKIDLSEEKNVQDIVGKYTDETSALDVQAIADAHRAAIEDSIAKRDIGKLMSLYDNKGMVAIAARHFKGVSKKTFESWIVRVLGNNSAVQVTHAFQNELPVVSAS